MAGLWKHPDGSYSRIAVPFDGTQISATATLADGSVVPVIDFHTREGERGQYLLSNGIEILSLDISPTSPWSFNANTGVVSNGTWNKRRNYVSPLGPLSNPVQGWTGGELSNSGSNNAVVSNNAGFIQVANVAANSGVAYKQFTLVKNSKYTFSVSLQNGSTPGTSYVLRLGSSKYGVSYVDDSQTTGVTLPTTRSFTFTATGTTLWVAMGNQNSSASNSTLWSVPTLLKV